MPEPSALPCHDHRPARGGPASAGPDGLLTAATAAYQPPDLVGTTRAAAIDTEPGRDPELAKAGLRAVQGDPLVLTTLEAAGALRADVLVACTRSDEDNLVSYVAKKHYKIATVIARVNDPATEGLFDQSWGVDFLASPVLLSTGVPKTAPWYEIPCRVLSTVPITMG